METPFSTDLQYYNNTGEVPGTSTGPVLVTSTVPVLNVEVLAKYWWSTGAVMAQYRRNTSEVPAEYWRSTSAVPAQYWHPVVRRYYTYWCCCTFLLLIFLFWNIILLKKFSEIFFQFCFLQIFFSRVLPLISPRLQRQNRLFMNLRWNWTFVSCDVYSIRHQFVLLTSRST